MNMGSLATAFQVEVCGDDLMTDSNAVIKAVRNEKSNRKLLKNAGTLVCLAEYSNSAMDVAATEQPGKRSEPTMWNYLSQYQDHHKGLTDTIACLPLKELSWIESRLPNFSK